MIKIIRIIMLAVTLLSICCFFTGVYLDCYAAGMVGILGIVFGLGVAISL